MNFINEKTSPCYLPQYANDLKTLQKLTNYVPRYMVWLKDSQDEETFISATMDKLQEWAEKYFEHLPQNKKNLYQETLQKMIYSGNLEGSIYDSGLVYKSFPGSPPTIINSLAQRILTKLYIQNKELLPVLENDLSATDRGLLLEQHLILRELIGYVTLSCHFTGNVNTKPTPLQFEIQQVAHYYSKNRGYIPFVTNPNKCTLYIPVKDNNFFPFVDHFIRKPHSTDYHKDLIIFNSATLPTVLEHMYNSKAKEEHKFGEIGLFLDPNMEKEIDDNDEKCTTCDKDTEGGWIQCDSCLMWEHLKCIGMNKEDIPKAEEGYICDKCKKKTFKKSEKSKNC